MSSKSYHQSLHCGATEKAEIIERYYGQICMLAPQLAFRELLVTVWDQYLSPSFLHSTPISILPPTGTSSQPPSITTSGIPSLANIVLNTTDTDPVATSAIVDACRNATFLVPLSLLAVLQKSYDNLVKLDQSIHGLDLSETAKKEVMFHFFRNCILRDLDDMWDQCVFGILPLFQSTWYRSVKRTQANENSFYQALAAFKGTSPVEDNNLTQTFELLHSKADQIGWESPYPLKDLFAVFHSTIIASVMMRQHFEDLRMQQRYVDESLQFGMNTSHTDFKAANELFHIYLKERNSLLLAVQQLGDGYFQERALLHSSKNPNSESVLPPPQLPPEAVLAVYVATNAAAAAAAAASLSTAAAASTTTSLPTAAAASPAAAAADASLAAAAATTTISAGTTAEAQISRGNGEMVEADSGTLTATATVQEPNSTTAATVLAEAATLLAETTTATAVTTAAAAEPEATPPTTVATTTATAAASTTEDIAPSATSPPQVPENAGKVPLLPTKHATIAETSKPSTAKNGEEEADKDKEASQVDSPAKDASRTENIGRYIRFLPEPCITEEAQKCLLGQFMANLKPGSSVDQYIPPTTPNNVAHLELHAFHKIQLCDARKIDSMSAGEFEAKPKGSQDGSKSKSSIKVLGDREHGLSLSDCFDYDSFPFLRCLAEDTRNECCKCDDLADEAKHTSSTVRKDNKDSSTDQHPTLFSAVELHQSPKPQTEISFFYPHNDKIGDVVCFCPLSGESYNFVAVEGRGDDKTPEFDISAGDWVDYARFKNGLTGKDLENVRNYEALFKKKAKSSRPHNTRIIVFKLTPGSRLIFCAGSYFHGTIIPQQECARSLLVFHDLIPDWNATFAKLGPPTNIGPMKAELRRRGYSDTKIKELEKGSWSNGSNDKTKKLRAAVLRARTERPFPASSVMLSNECAHAASTTSPTAAATASTTAAATTTTTTAEAEIVSPTAAADVSVAAATTTTSLPTAASAGPAADASLAAAAAAIITAGTTSSAVAGVDPSSGACPAMGELCKNANLQCQRHICSGCGLSVHSIPPCSNETSPGQVTCANANCSEKLRLAADASLAAAGTTAAAAAAAAASPSTTTVARAAAPTKRTATVADIATAADDTAPPTKKKRGPPQQQLKHVKPGEAYLVCPTCDHVKRITNTNGKDNRLLRALKLDPADALKRRKVDTMYPPDLGVNPLTKKKRKLPHNGVLPKMREHVICCHRADNGLASDYIVPESDLPPLYRDRRYTGDADAHQNESPKSKRKRYYDEHKGYVEKLERLVRHAYNNESVRKIMDWRRSDIPIPDDRLLPGEHALHKN